MEWKDHLKSFGAMRNESRPPKKKEGRKCYAPGGSSGSLDQSDSSDQSDQEGERQNRFKQIHHSSADLSYSESPRHHASRSLSYSDPRIPFSRSRSPQKEPKNQQPKRKKTQIVQGAQSQLQKQPPLQKKLQIVQGAQSQQPRSPSPFSKLENHFTPNFINKHFERQGDKSVSQEVQKRIEIKSRNRIAKDKIPISSVIALKTDGANNLNNYMKQNPIKDHKRKLIPINGKGYNYRNSVSPGGSFKHEVIENPTMLVNSQNDPKKRVDHLNKIEK